MWSYLAVRFIISLVLWCVSSSQETIREQTEALELANLRSSQVDEFLEATKSKFIVEKPSDSM